jgi:lysophospholipase L1-like esterase
VAIVATVLSALSLVIAAPAPATAGATAPGTTAAVQQAGTAAFLAALRANTRDLSLVVLGDSTGDEPYEWVRLTATHLASVFPRHTLLYYAWDKRTAKWRPAETVRRGTGSRTLRLWNGSVSGKSTHYPLPRLVRQVQGPRPDLVLLSFGHNEGVRSGAGADADRWGGQYTALVESVALLAPAATITHVLQNPRFVAGEESLQARRQAVYANLARGRGQGTIDAHRPFLANPRWTTEWMRDPIHPNEAGQAAAWAPAVAAALTRGPRGRPSRPSARRWQPRCASTWRTARSRSSPGGRGFRRAGRRTPA